MALFLQSTTRKDIRFQITKFDPVTSDMRLRAVASGVEFTMPKMTAAELTRLDYRVESVADTPAVPA